MSLARASDAPPFATSLPRVRLSGPADLAVCVPYLLGFVPSDSIVAVSLDAARELALLARVDLPAGDPTGWSAAAAEFGARIGTAAVRAGAVAMVVVLYPARSDDGVGPARAWRTFTDRVGVALDRAGIDLLDALLVRDGRWWSLQCLDAACCPSEGTLLPPAGSTAAEVGVVAAGLTVQPGRASMGVALLPADEPARDEFARLVDAVRLGPGEGLRLVDDALERRLAASSAPDLHELAAVLVAVDDVQVRDAVSHCATHAESQAAIALWTSVLPLAPDRLLPNAACLLASAAYQDGRGLLASLALERALEVRPDHTLAGDLDRALEAGVPPHELDEAFAAASAEARARIGGG